MKKLKYSAGFKIFLIIMQWVFIAVLGLCCFAIIYAVDLDSNWKLELGDYKNSAPCKEQYFSDVSDIISYVRAKEKFETDGELDYSKMVVPNNMDEFSPSEAAFSVREVMRTLTEGMDWFYEEQNELTEETPGDIAATEEEGVVVDGTARSEEALYRLTEELSRYWDLDGRYSADSTNLAFYVENLTTKAVYTNKEITPEQIESMEIYNRFSTEDYKAEGVKENHNDSLLSFISALKTNSESEYVAYIGLDTDFPVNDQYAVNNDRYDFIGQWYRVIWIAVPVCIIGILFCFIYLILAAGYKEGVEGIYLSRFDRIYTEIAVILIVIAVSLVGSMALSIGYQSEYIDLTASVIIETGLLTLEYIIIWYGITSMVRRMKAGRFMSNMLIVSIVKYLMDIILNRRVTTKTMVLFLTYAVFNLLCILAGGVGIFFWLILNMVTCFILMNNAIDYHNIALGARKIANGDLEYKIIDKKLKGYNKELAQSINNIGNGLYKAVDASLKSERLKTDLITNVSHDIKTPLTSIINYVDLLKRENIETEPVKSYIEVLDNKSQRLKNLTEDLVEASKLSSGNVTVHMEPLNFVELVNQTIGEFSEKFEAKGLQVVANLPSEAVMIEADGRRMWRVLENLYNNIAKYALENTRVYLDMKAGGEQVLLSIKNISASPLNITTEELMERFTRGDVSRTTEGSGLGLSIAQSLMELQKGKFNIHLDGDLFKVTLEFNRLSARGQETEEQEMKKEIN